MSMVATRGPERQAWITPTNRMSLFARLLGPEALPVVVRRGAKGPKRWGWFDQFDMVLVRGMSPSSAADQLGKLMPFSKDRGVPGSAFGHAAFRLLKPEEVK